MATTALAIRSPHRDWTPVRRANGVYCSPACGGNCTRKDFDNAVTKAQRCARRLGDGWQPRVWENLGWHWEVSKGHLVGDDFRGVIVRFRRYDPKYDAEFRSVLNGTSTVTQFFAAADTPEEAVRLVRATALKYVENVVADLWASA